MNTNLLFNIDNTVKRVPAFSRFIERIGEGFLPTIEAHAVACPPAGATVISSWGTADGCGPCVSCLQGNQKAQPGKICRTYRFGCCTYGNCCTECFWDSGSCGTCAS